MSVMRRLANRFVIVQELLRVLWQQRLWWLIPMIIVLLGLGFLVSLAQSTPLLAPFVYTLF